MRQQKEVQLLGQRVILSERSAEDVFAFLSLLEEQEKKEVINLSFFNAYIISDSMKYYIDGLKPWQRWFYRRRFSTGNLLKKMTIVELSEAAKIVLELEGAEKKKGRGKESRKKSATR